MLFDCRSCIILIIELTIITSDKSFRPILGSVINLGWKISPDLQYVKIDDYKLMIFLQFNSCFSHCTSSILSGPLKPATPCHDYNTEH